MKKGRQYNRHINTYLMAKTRKHP